MQRLFSVTSVATALALVFMGPDALAGSQETQGIMEAGTAATASRKASRRFPFVGAPTCRNSSKNGSDNPGTAPSTWSRPAPSSSRRTAQPAVWA